MRCAKCGNELSPGNLFCGKCGTKMGGELENRQSDGVPPPPTSEANRTAEIGLDLGNSTLATDTLFDTGCGGCLLTPFVIINPFIWIQWYYKAKAIKALGRGDLNLAKAYKDKSTLFAVMGWIAIVAALFIGWLWFKKLI